MSAQTLYRQSFMLSSSRSAGDALWGALGPRLAVASASDAKQPNAKTVDALTPIFGGGQDRRSVGGFACAGLINLILADGGGPVAGGGLTGRRWSFGAQGVAMIA